MIVIVYIKEYLETGVREIRARMTGVIHVDGMVEGRGVGKIIQRELLQ